MDRERLKRWWICEPNVNIIPLIEPTDKIKVWYVDGEFRHYFRNYIVYPDRLVYTKLPWREEYGMAIEGGYGIQMEPPYFQFIHKLKLI
jgi:hypothetical protein